MAKNASSTSAPVSSTALARPDATPAGLDRAAESLLSGDVFEVAPSDIRRIAAEYSLEKTAKLLEGQGIEGTFLGEGPPVDMEDPATGEIRVIKTWRIRAKSGAVARLLGGAQLDHELPVFPIGSPIVVVRGPQVNTRKGRRVNDYIIGGARPLEK